MGSVYWSVGGDLLYAILYPAVCRIEPGLGVAVILYDSGRFLVTIRQRRLSDPIGLSRFRLSTPPPYQCVGYVPLHARAVRVFRFGRDSLALFCHHLRTLSDASLVDSCTLWPNWLPKHMYKNFEDVADQDPRVCVSFAIASGRWNF